MIIEGKRWVIGNIFALFRFRRSFYIIICEILSRIIIFSSVQRFLTFIQILRDFFCNFMQYEYNFSLFIVALFKCVYAIWLFKRFIFSANSEQIKIVRSYGITGINLLQIVLLYPLIVSFLGIEMIKNTRD